MLFHVNTDKLISAALTLAAANKAIDEATSVLMSVTVHNNWNCKERGIINDYILDNRKKIQALQGRSDSFAQIAKQVADEFVDDENSISSMFSSVEAVIGRVLANPISTIISNISPETVGTGGISKINWSNVGKGLSGGGVIVPILPPDPGPIWRPVSQVLPNGAMSFNGRKPNSAAAAAIQGALPYTTCNGYGASPISMTNFRDLDL